MGRNVLGKGGVSRKLAAGGERELRYGFINVHESQASGNSFSSPVADKHVSGQCLCLRRRWVHYKVLDLLLSLSFSFTYVAVWIYQHLNCK